jgi:hypothetical protein
MSLAAMRVRLMILFALSGCHFFVPDTRTAADRAREVAPRCQGFTDASAVTLLSPAGIDSVEPAYSYVQSGPGDRQARLRGARIHLKPIAALSRESIARNLECHESRFLLGSTEPLVDDPYGVASQWLDIDVDSEKDGFVVRVQTDDSPTAREVLARAKRFAASRPAN